MANFFQTLERMETSGHRHTYASSRRLFVPRYAAVRLSLHCGERDHLIED